MDARLTLRRLLAAVILLCCVALAAVAQTGAVDGVEKWAWGTNIGWINFQPEHGGVVIYADHLEGYAWGENVGWIRLGTHEDGDTHTYANTSAANYGVNRDAAGNLSGYAWGTNIGWINFDPQHGGVSIEPLTGSFVGYAWGENIGWIHFEGATYNVKIGKGDINGDERVDVLDARLCLQIANGTMTGTAEQRSAADVDGDGDVDIDDAVILSEYVVGIRTTLP